MNTLVEQINEDLSAIVARAQAGLVQIRNGHLGAGAGAVWHPDGLIVTNAHVVRLRRPAIVLADGRTIPARLLAVDTDNDLAALEVEEHGLPSVSLGASRQVRPGQWVVAIGHPWGVQGAATVGVVIGQGNDLPGVSAGRREILAVSLHLRPGHSGGVVVDESGRVVGINTMMAGPDVGLAVPVDVAKRFVKRALGSRAPTSN